MNSKLTVTDFQKFSKTECMRPDLFEKGKNSCKVCLMAGTCLFKNNVA